MKKAMAGTPICLTIGTDHGELEMAGESAASVRVCDGSGSEYLFDIVRGDGSSARDGVIEAGDRLVIPAECNANSSKTYYVYFRNTRAWPVPDFFEASPGIRNGNMESGEGRPSGWAFDAGDQQHRVSWVTEDPHSGIYCLKTEVAEGAETTWIAVRQANIHVFGGCKYVLRGWVKADRKVVHYISDGPHYRDEGIIPQMQKLCEMIHEAEPEIKIYSSTWGHVPEWDGYLDIWGVGAYGVFPVKEMGARLKDGDEIWFTTDGQMATDTPYCAIERLYPYYCWRYGASGYEFWGVSWWTYNPFRFGWHSYGRQSSAPGKYVSVRYPNGDGFLTYPGWMIGEDGPISSIRLEQVREGIEDYEYLYLLKRNMDAAEEKGLDTSAAELALAAAEDLVTIPNAGGLRSTEIMPEPDAVSTMRFHIGEEIAGLIKSLSR